MSRPSYSVAKTAKKRDFSGTVEDTDIINTPLEPLRPADVPFGGFIDIAFHFGGEIPKKKFFGRE